jgi:hypothetical protein
MRIFKKKFSDLYCKPLQNNWRSYRYCKWYDVWFGCRTGREMHMKFIRFQELFRLDVWLTNTILIQLVHLWRIQTVWIGRENHKMIITVRQKIC